MCFKIQVFSFSWEIRNGLFFEMGPVCHDPHNPARHTLSLTFPRGLHQHPAGASSAHGSCFVPELLNPGFSKPLNSSVKIASRNTQQKWLRTKGKAISDFSHAPPPRWAWSRTDIQVTMYWGENNRNFLMWLKTHFISFSILPSLHPAQHCAPFCGFTVSLQAWPRLRTELECDLRLERCTKS